MFHLSQVLTPCRFGRRSLPLRANVRVGPPAMSSSARDLLLPHFCGSIYQNLMKTETALTPKTSQRPTEGAFFSSESAEKNRTGWSAKACLHDSRNANTFGWWAKACLHRKVRKPITLNGFLNSSPRIKRLTQRRRHIHPYPLRVARNQREDYDGRHIRQHAQKLTRYF